MSEPLPSPPAPAEETLAAHAGRVLRERMAAVSAQLFGPGGALHQRPDMAAGWSRLRACLVPLCMLACGMAAGGAVAFDLLQEMVFEVAVENRRLEAALARKSKVTAAARQDLAQAPARQVDLPRKPATVVPTPVAKEGDCSAIPNDNIVALMDCIHKLNR